MQYNFIVVNLAIPAFLAIFSECPPGFVNLAGTTSCYNYQIGTKNWQEAKDACAALYGSRLAGVESVAERNIIRPYIKSTLFANSQTCVYKKKTYIHTLT